MLVHKTSAGDTGATWTVASPSSFGVYFFELVGAHSLDVSSTSGMADADVINLPTITPTVGSVVFGAAAAALEPSNPIQSIGPLQLDWIRAGAVATGGGKRCLLLIMHEVPSTGASITPPILNMGDLGTIFPGSGVAYGVFSIL
jgi:hypothetical protein